MVHPVDVATAGVLAWVGTNLVVSARQGMRPAARRHNVQIVTGLRPRHFLGAVPVLALVLGAAVVLLEVPPLRFGWWTALGGLGNPVIGSSSRLRGSILEWAIPAVFVALLVPMLPLFAEREEHMFRLGAEGWPTRHRVTRCVEFGLAHALIGIPIGVALALSIGGGYFMLVYLRETSRAGQSAGVLASTRAHLGYNLVIIAVILAALGLGSIT